MNNTWLEVNKSFFDKIKKFLIECEYKPEYQNFPIILIQKIMNGCIVEIKKLQLENNNLKKEISQLKKIIED
jgi:hypothetical protein